MHAFKLSVTAGTANARYPAGTATSALCLVDSLDAEAARDRTLHELNALGWESCTFLDVGLLPPAPDLAGFAPAMREAYGTAKLRGACLILYPPADAAS